MPRNRLFVVAALTGLALFAATLAPSASAEELTCEGTLADVTVGDLRVPRNSACVLRGTRVTGSIHVDRNARLTAGRVDVAGDVEAVDSARVVLLRSRVGGSVQLNRVKIVRLRQARIAGDLAFQGTIGWSRAVRNRVGGSVRVNSHRGRLDLWGNVIAGDLQCLQNTPGPRGSGNLVGGLNEGQCAGL